MDDQRCSLAVPNSTVGGAAGGVSGGAIKKVPSTKGPKGGKDDLLDMIAGVQGHRLNEQRAPVNFLPGLLTKSPGNTGDKPPEILQRLSVAASKDPQSLPDDSFFEMLMKCQGTRIEEQRSSLPQEQRQRSAHAAVGAVKATGGQQNATGSPVQHAPTVPDEDFFSLIQRLQGGRLEDQRATLPEIQK